ncbi:MAG TPA: hypothetical protein VMW38_06160 [Terriglobia bacterium]|nr:hypothetical protein [Terriglobia bacterium]
MLTLRSAGRNACRYCPVDSQEPVSLQFSRDLLHENVATLAASGVALFVTWRLYGSLPGEVLNKRFETALRRIG